MGNVFLSDGQRIQVLWATNLSSSCNEVEFFRHRNFRPSLQKTQACLALRSVCTFFDINSNRKWLHLLLSSFFLLIFAAQIPYTMKKELGKWMMDVAKYQVTAIFLSSIFSDIQDRSLIYCIVTITTTISLGVGLWLIQDKKQEDKK